MQVSGLPSGRNPKGHAIFMIAWPFAFQQILTAHPALTLPHTPARAGNTRAAARVLWGGKLPFRAIHTGGIIGTNAEVHQIESSGSVVLSVSGSIDSFSEPETTFFLAIDTVYGHTQAPDGVKGGEAGTGATRSHAQARTGQLCWPSMASMGSMARTHPLRPAGARV